MVKIPSLLYRVVWLFSSHQAGKTDKDQRDLIVITGLLLVILAALTHTTG